MEGHTYHVSYTDIIKVSAHPVYQSKYDKNKENPVQYIFPLTKLIFYALVTILCVDNSYVLTVTTRRDGIMFVFLLPAHVEPECNY